MDRYKIVAVGVFGVSLLVVLFWQGAHQPPRPTPKITIIDGTSTDRSSSSPLLSEHVPSSDSSSADILAAIQRYDGENDLYAYNISTVIDGSRYILIEYAPNGDPNVLYAVYDKLNKEITSIPIPVGDFRIDSPDRASVLFVEPTRVFVFHQNSPAVTIAPLRNDLTVDESFVAEYATPFKPSILAKTSTSITLQVYKRDIEGDMGQTYFAPSRTETISF